MPDEKPTPPPRKSELLPGESLHMGQKLWAPHKNASLVFQKEGNVVWYAHTKGGPVALWATGSPAPTGNLFSMQKDGNLVLYNFTPAGGPRGVKFTFANLHRFPRTAVWSSGTAGRPGAKLVVQDDGNVVIYHGRTAIWSTQTAGWLKTPGWRKKSGGMFSWVGNVISTAGAALHSVAKAAVSVTGALSKVVGKIPIVGGPLSAAFDVALTGPFRVTDGIVTGKRIDKVVMGELKAGVNVAKEVAPYAQTVLSLAPGVGSGLSGAIGAGLAIAEGRPITEALKQGLKDAAPGGPAGRAIMAVATGIMSGDRIDTIALAAIPIPDAQKQALAKALEVTKAVASGQRVDKIALDQAKGVIENVAKQVGPDVAKSLKVGISIGHAEQLQKIMKTQAASAPVLKTLVADAKKTIPLDPVLAQGIKIVPKGTAGFMVGAALMKKRITPTEFLTIRNRLKGDNRKAFDIATSMHVGRVTNKEPPKLKDNPAARAGYYATMGMQGAKMSQKVGMLKVIAKSPARHGVKLAVQSARKNNLSLWGRIKYYVGIHGDDFGGDDFGAAKPAPRKVPPKPRPRPSIAHPGPMRIIRHHRVMPSR